MTLLEYTTIFFSIIALIPAIYFLNVQINKKLLNGDTRLVRVGTIILGVALVFSVLFDIFVAIANHSIETAFIKHIRLWSDIFFSIGIWYFVIIWLRLMRKH